MVSTPFLTLAGSLARTANGQSDGVDLVSLWPNGHAQPPSMRVQLDITAVSGTTPSLTVVIEDSIDGGQTWNTVGTFAAQSAVSRTVIGIAISGVAQAAGFAWPFNARKTRARWTITGTTPSFTFSLKAVLI